MIKINKHLKNIRNKPEEYRIKIMWISVIFCMTIILGGWFIIYRLSNPGNHENRIASEFSQVPSFPNLQKNIVDINHQKENLLGKVADIAKKTEIENIALAYMKENKLISDDNILNLKLESIEKLKNNWHLEYRQYYQDILVNDSNISFLINDAEKKVISHLFNFDSDINLSGVEPRITKEKAYEIAKKDLNKNLNNGGNNNSDLKSSELVIYKKINKNSTEHRLTWKLNIFSLQPLYNYYYFIDAENGEIVSYFDSH